MFLSLPQGSLCVTTRLGGGKKGACREREAKREEGPRLLLFPSSPRAYYYCLTVASMAAKNKNNKQHNINLPRAPSSWSHFGYCFFKKWEALKFSESLKIKKFRHQLICVFFFFLILVSAWVLFWRLAIVERMLPSGHAWSLL